MTMRSFSCPSNNYVCMLSSSYLKDCFLNAVFLLLKIINITRLLLNELSWMVENI